MLALSAQLLFAPSHVIPNNVASTLLIEFLICSSVPSFRYTIPAAAPAEAMLPAPHIGVNIPV